MRLIVPFFLLLLGAVQAAEPLLSEADLKLAADLRDQALEANEAWSILESLTTEVGPRAAGTEGDARAVRWGQAKFKAMGFDRVTIEPVTFPRWVRGEETASVTAPYPQPLVVTALGGSIGTAAGGLTAEVVEFKTIKDLEDADDDSLGGRIAYISNRMQRFKNGAGYGPAVAARSKGASVAAQKGASAVLIRSIGTDDNRTPHTGMMRYTEGVAKIPAAALSNPDADLLSAMVKRGEAVSVQLSLGAHWDGEYTSHNVIGDILGREKPDEFVIIGCHLDSWDLGTGAIDDGSGCAITMAAANLIGQLPQRPRRTVRVVLFANEEQGLWGGAAYQEAHQSEMMQHIVGSESDFGAGRIYRFSSRVKPEALGVVDQLSQLLAPLGITRGDNKARGGPDLLAMKKAGMAVFSLYQDGTDYFDYHHTANDTLDKVDPDALTQNTAAYAVFSWLSAEMQGDFGFDLEPKVETE
jgi:hypothetical protein